MYCLSGQKQANAAPTQETGSLNACNPHLVLLTFDVNLQAPSLLQPRRPGPPRLLSTVHHMEFPTKAGIVSIPVCGFWSMGP